MANKDASGKSYGAGRTRNFTSVFYPESCPPDWETILQNAKVQAVVSPLHSDDENPTGEAKKPHYHIVVRFSSVKRKEQAQEVFDLIGGVGCEAVKDLRQMCRYLCHLDNPEKAQYSIDDVKTFGGFDYYEVIMSAADENEMLKDITYFVTNNHITNFAKFQRWNVKNRPDWFRAIASHYSYYVAQLVKSERYNDDNELTGLVDNDGVIISDDSDGEN